MNTVLVCLTVAAWGFCCLGMCRAWRATPLLAGPTAAAGFFFVGAAMVCGVMVPRSVYLAPLWVAMGVALLVHLAGALRLGQRQWEPQRESCVEAAAETGNSSETGELAI